MNIVEKYQELNDGMFIIISGLSGTGKTKLAKNMAKDFKLDMINENKYCDKDYYKKAKKVMIGGDHEIPTYISPISDTQTSATEESTTNEKKN